MDLCLIASLASTLSTCGQSSCSCSLGLGIVIFVHELGHFLVAKACGVKCEKFYVGFDAPLGIGPIRLPSALFKTSMGRNGIRYRHHPAGWLRQNAGAGRQSSQCRQGGGTYSRRQDRTTTARTRSPQLSGQVRAPTDGHHFGRGHHECHLSRSSSPRWPIAWESRLLRRKSVIRVAGSPSWEAGCSPVIASSKLDAERSTR